jgi:hypothetical protein
MLSSTLLILSLRVDGEMLEDALCLGPKEELLLFQARDTFDLVVFYDEASESFGPPSSYISVLNRAIYENAFRKFLKNMPVLLIGGLHAWKREVGIDYLEATASVTTQQLSSNGHMNTTAHFTSIGTSIPLPAPLPSSAQWTTSSASSSVTPTSISHASSSGHLNSRPRADTTPQPPASFPSGVRHSIDITSPRHASFLSPIFSLQCIDSKLGPNPFLTVQGVSTDFLRRLHPSQDGEIPFHTLPVHYLAQYPRMYAVVS